MGYCAIILHCHADSNTIGGSLPMVEQETMKLSPRHPIEDSFSRLEATELFRRIDAIGERLGAFAISFAAMAEREKYLTHELSEMNTALEKLNARLQKIEHSSARVLGGIAALVALGTILGWAVTSWQTIIQFFARGVK